MNWDVKKISEVINSFIYSELIFLRKSQIVAQGLQ